MKILFIVPYSSEGASNRFRVEQYLPYLDKEGIEYDVRPFVSSQFYKILYSKRNCIKKIIYFICAFFNRMLDVIRLYHYDIVFIHRESCPFGPPVFEWLMYKFGKPIIYDFDDAIFLQNYNIANRFYSFLKFPSKTKEIIKMASGVIVPNIFLKEYACKFNKQVYIIPTSIDTDRFKMAEKPSDKLTIGWVGSFTTAPYLRVVFNAMQELSKKYDFTLKVFGAGEEISIPGVKVENHGWYLEKEVEYFQSMDIGIYPLIDSLWARGKAGFKAIQYMASGVPVVASSVGMNKEIIQDGVNGFLVSTDQEWVERISALIEDKGLRKRIGSSGRKTAEEKYSVRVNFPKILKILNDLYLLSFPRKRESIKDNFVMDARLRGHDMGNEHMSNGRIRVLHIIASSRIGGSENVLLALAGNFDKSRFEIYIACPEGGELADKYAACAEKIFYLNLTNIFNLFTVASLVKIMRKHSIDIVHTHLPTADFLGMVSARLSGVKRVICSFYGMNFLPLNYKGISYVRKSILSRCYRVIYRIGMVSRVIAVCDAVKNDLVFRPGIKLKPEDVTVIKNPGDTTVFNRSMENIGLETAQGRTYKYDIGVFANFYRIKGHEIFIKAMSLLKEKHPGLRVILVGDGEEKTCIDAMIKDMALEKNICMEGLRDDIKGVMKDCNIVVLPSLSEGFPLILIEASFEGKAIVATKVGGVPEIIEDNVSGILVRPYDPVKLSEGIAYLLENRDIARKLGATAFEKAAKRFFIEDTVSGVEKIYEELC